MKCWGHNLSAQVGTGEVTTNEPAPRTVSGISTAGRSIATGSFHTCTVIPSGSVRCWGSNTDGRLGDGTTTHRILPITVSGISDVIEVAAGASHTCALRATGAVLCWGLNANGQIGDASTVSRSTPVGVVVYG